MNKKFFNTRDVRCSRMKHHRNQKILSVLLETLHLLQVKMTLTMKTISLLCMRKGQSCVLIRLLQADAVSQASAYTVIVRKRLNSGLNSG